MQLMNRSLKHFSAEYYVWLFLNTILVSSHIYPENPEGTQVIVGSMNMGYGLYIRHCQESNSQPVPSKIPLGHSDGRFASFSHLYSKHNHAPSSKYVAELSQHTGISVHTRSVLGKYWNFDFIVQNRIITG